MVLIGMVAYEPAVSAGSPTFSLATNWCTIGCLVNLAGTVVLTQIINGMVNVSLTLDSNYNLRL